MELETTPSLHPPIPEGWRQLEEGEEVQEGDLGSYAFVRSGWRPCRGYRGVLAHTEMSEDFCFIRKIGSNE